MRPNPLRADHPRPADEPWFPAKRYGWGWGPPRRWQGWVVFGAYFALLWMGRGLLRTHGPGGFLLYVLLLTIILMGICWWKGEKPRWRWGN